MKLTVFGATGKTGKEVVKQALNEGHQVTAYVRTVSKIDSQHERLEVVQGELSELEKVRVAVQGADAVISALGPINNKPVTPLTEGMQVIVIAMKQENVKRIVLATGAGVADPNDEPKFINHIISTVLKLMAGNVLKDSRGMVDTIKSSELEWVIVRVPRLTENPATGNIKAGYVGKGVGMQLTRADFAAFMLEQTQADSWLRQAPAISS